jgi:hypothetical protein
LQPDDFAVAVAQRIAAMMNVMARIIAAGYIALSLPSGEQERHNPHVKHWEITLAIVAALSASLLPTDDFKTTNDYRR